MSNETSQETWNATHAQLLKSVADAQAKLLAAQNETNDRLEVLDKLSGQLANFDLQFIANQNTMLSGRLDAMKGVLGGLGASLAELASRQEQPRRQVERLQPKRIVKRAVERKRR